MTKKIIVVILLLLMAILCFSYFPEYQKSGSVIKQDERGMSIETYLRKVNNPDKLVLVYFHASWCMPCVKLKPEIDALETDKKAVCEILRLDTDANPQINEYFEINTLPMFILYKNGKKVWENNGYQTQQQLSLKIDIFKNK